MIEIHDTTRRHHIGSRAIVMRDVVLIVDNDEVICDLVADVLRDEGFAVARLAVPDLSAIQDEVARLDPEVVLLDGADAVSYGRSWGSAAWLHARRPNVPVVMFTAHAVDLAEGQLGQTVRSREAAFAGFVAKPFDVTVLVDVVKRVTQAPQPASLVTTSR
jgi:DNA-binding response OmpR family regulator